MQRQGERNWHYLTNAELEQLFQSDIATGLSDAEAASRLRRKKNRIWEVKSADIKKYAVQTLADLTTLILAVTVLAAAAFGGGKAAAAVFIMLAAARCARIAAYIKSQRVMEANARAALPRAKVVRGGNVKIVPADLIAVGDVIILDTGDTVPCDIRLTVADGVMVAEGAVTDINGISSKNSLPMPRAAHEVPVALRSNMVYATGAVVDGFAVGIAVATGKDTLVAAREGTVELSDSSEVPVLESLADWSRVCSLSLTGAAFLLTLIGSLAGGSLFQVFLPSVAMAAACLSEYLVAAGSVAWAFSLKSHGGEVMRSAAAAETAAGANVLVLRSPQVLKSGKTTLHSYYRNSKLTLMGTKGADAPQRLLALACYCTGTTPGGSISSGSFGIKTRHTGPLPYSLVRSLWETHGNAAADPGYTIVQHVSAGEENSGGLDSVLLAKENSFYFAVAGRVSDVVRCCTSQRIGNEIVPLDDAGRAKIADYAKNLRLRGVTLCAVGFRRSHYNSLRRISVLQSSICFEGFFAVSERMEEDAASLIRSYRRGGGRVVVFSDGSDEDKYFLGSEGVFKTGDAYITEKECTAIKAMPADPGSLAVVCVPGGVGGIKERLRILNLFRDGGEEDGKKNCCAYIGCGVEDMWCMQAADASFAVPDRASGGIPQMLRTVADGIVGGGSGGFCGAYRLMERCRHALVNISGILKYLIISHVARLVVMLICAATSMPMPSAPQLVFWGLMLDFSVSLAIAAVPYKAGREEYSSNVHAMPEDALSVLIPTLYGALCALFAAAIPFAVRGISLAAGMDVTLSGAALRCCMFMSCIFAMPFAAAETAGGSGIFSRHSVWGKMFVLPYAVSAMGIVLSAFVPPTSAVFGTEFPGWIMTVSCVFCAAFLIAVMSLIRALQNKKNKKDTKENI